MTADTTSADTPSGLASAWQRYVAKARRPGLALLLVCTTSFMAIRFLWQVGQFASDVLFWDQWDLWNSFFDHDGPWKMWRFQFGPQRQGLAQWILAALVWAFDWNPRAESLGAAVIILLAALVGMATVRSLRGRWSIADALVPMALLTVSLVVVATEVPNLAHGPLPMLLIMTCGYFAQVKRERVRVLGLAVTLALSIQTGFTWFMAIVVVPLQILLLVDAIRSRHPLRDHLAGLALVVASLALFFYGFAFQPAVACFHFPDPQPWRYLVFMAVMVERMLEAPWHFVGVIGAVLGLGLAVWGAWTTLMSAGRDRLATTVYVLSAFWLTFSANTAVGRLCLGYPAGAAGRYVPYTLALLMAGYLFVALWPRFGRLRPALLAAFLAFLLMKETLFVHRPLDEARHFARIKSSFRSCFLDKGDVAACSARWAVHPNHVASNIQHKLDYLRVHGLGLFRPGAK